MRTLRLDILDPKVLDLLRAVGVPYSWGAGRPTVANWPEGVTGLNGGIGYDCSGFAQAALVRLGLLVEGSKDRSAAALFEGAKQLVDEEAKLGDLAFYGVRSVSHVTVCLGGGLCIGANGGGSKTNGDDPTAFVRVERIRYRTDFRGVRRLPK